MRNALFHGSPAAIWSGVLERLMRGGCKAAIVRKRKLKQESPGAFYSAGALIVSETRHRALSPEFYLMNNISRYVGSGQRSSATMVYRLSPASRRLPRAVKICSRVCLAWS